MDLGQDADAFKVTRYTRKARTHPRDAPSSDSRKGKGRGSRTNFIYQGVGTFYRNEDLFANAWGAGYSV